MTDKWVRLGKLLHIPKKKMLKTQEHYGTLDVLVGLPRCTTLTERELGKVQEFVRLSREFLPRLQSPISHVLDLWELTEDMGATEQMWVIACVGTQVLKPWPVGYGATGHVVIPVPSIISYLLRVGAKEFYLVHTHPAGFPTPSPDDLEITSDIARAAEGFGLKLMDHLVITPYTVYSIAMSGDVEELPRPPGSDEGCLFVLEEVPDEVAGISRGSRESDPGGVGDAPERTSGPADPPAAQDIS